MICRQVVLAFAVITLCFAPSVVRGDDLADLRAVFDKDIRLFNAHNKDAFVASAHDDIILFGILSPFAVKGKEALRQLMQGYFDDHVRVMFTPVNPEFFVAGTSALAWGHYTIAEQPKVGPRETIHGRYTFTYTKVDGKWLLVAMHLSPLQGY